AALPIRNAPRTAVHSCVSSPIQARPAPRGARHLKGAHDSDGPAGHPRTEYGSTPTGSPRPRDELPRESTECAGGEGTAPGGLGACPGPSWVRPAGSAVQAAAPGTAATAQEQHSGAAGDQRRSDAAADGEGATAAARL